MNLGEFTDFLFSQEENICYFLISPCLLLFDAFVLGGKGESFTVITHRDR